jgi:two-component system, cell cycle response regulator
MKVLIAEDDFTSRTILEGMLKKWGYQPVVTENGDAAWEAMQLPGAPNLAVLDWNMPGVDGLEICRRLRRQNKSNPPYLIILTARGEKSDIVDGLEAGANDFISKPYDREELRARIRVGQRLVELQAELTHAYDALAHEASHDSLTGVLNRRIVRDMLAKELARMKREGGRTYVGLFDLDHFKAVNDNYGHQAGDEVLCGFVHCIRGNLREYDQIGRYGGEEFLVIVSGPQDWNGVALFERLCDRVGQCELASSAGPIKVTVSVGVACSVGEDTVDTLVARADAALYRAKNSGRNRSVFSPIESSSGDKVVLLLQQ